jgi:K+-sensing histidine kinase KdpD
MVPVYLVKTLKRYFSLFYRIPMINLDPKGGAGLGLAITERVIRMYGGSVSATNADGGLILNMELSLSESE